MQSISNKIDEISTVLGYSNIEITIFTETWLTDVIPSDPFNIDGYVLIRNDRSGKRGGGVCIYIKEDIPFKHWSQLETEKESVWITIRPKRMPRDIPCLTIAGIYHPPNANNRDMGDHLNSGIDSIASTHPLSGFMILGDFNSFPDWYMTNTHSFTQLVKKPTRKSVILDKCFTNCKPFYQNAEILPHFGKSDHHAFICKPKKTIKYDKGHIRKERKQIMNRNEKSLFAHAISQVDWTPMYRMDSCEIQFVYFDTIMETFMNTYLPFKTTAIHSKDKSWITPEFKSLISERQSALHSGNTQRYNNLRNKINRESKKLRRSFFKGKMEHLTESDSKQWWRHVKALVGLSKQDNTSALSGLANAVSGGDIETLAGDINHFFHSVSADLPPLPEENRFKVEDIPAKFSVTVQEVESQLARVKPNKAPGPDGIMSWMLRDLSTHLAGPVAALFNSSIRDGFVPQKWKSAHITALPKKTPPQSIQSDLRPVSLTSLLAKELERIITPWLKESFAYQTDHLQFGNQQGVSTTHMLVKMLHLWHKALDESNTAIRIVFLDFAKAFDRINHNKLLDKYESLETPPTILRWLYSFLQGRTQSVKLGNKISAPKTINGAVPQGAILGLECFTTMIDDMTAEHPVYKYVDDSTPFEILKCNSVSTLQGSINTIQQWSRTNDMRLNAKKTHEMTICFKQKRPKFDPILIDSAPVQSVESAKLVGVIIQKDLKWDENTNNILRKAQKRLYFLKRLKQAGTSKKDLFRFYTSIVRPVCEYAAPVWATSLTQAQKDKVFKSEPFIS